MPGSIAERAGGLGVRIVVLWALLVLLAGCATSSTYQYDLIPIPVTFSEQAAEDASPDGILYVTDREPADPEDRVLYYQYERASALRVGIAKVDYSGKPRTEEELDELASVEPGKKSDFPLSVTDVNEFGYLESAMPTPFLTSQEELGSSAPADEEFVSLINMKLAASRSGDIYLYVHGYKVIFENPVIVSAQLWYFMNNEGVFLPFAWTATPKRFAYIKDTQTAEISARNLRLLLQFLMENTDVERIHIIGYSAGTRVVIGALNQLALMQTGQSESTTKGRIGQVAIVGSDYDRQRWVAAVADGLLQVPETLTIYVSPYDDALGLSELVFGGARLGKLETDPVSETVRDWLISNERLYFVDVTGVVGSETRNGHAYFQTSPWISSDILATLLYGLTPAERGLVRKTDALSWSFPPQYDVGLKAIIEAQASQ
ncbi:MAG: alpha/beta hydrolase [Gammaproteobacteria bacterium]|nr:alpha/beta hydrolase [Gammaproteobacteria bacterium]